jgi:prevent-host-death family protein
VRTVSATAARVHFGELIRTVVETKQPVLVERGGEPQVVVLAISEYERLRTQGNGTEEPWEALLRQAHEQIDAELGSRSLPPSEQLIQESRDERDCQILDLR